MARIPRAFDAETVNVVAACTCTRAHGPVFKPTTNTSRERFSRNAMYRLDEVPTKEGKVERNERKENTVESHRVVG